MYIIHIGYNNVFTSHHMEEHLPNDDLIRKLCSQYDKALYMENDSIENDAQGMKV